jgi:uncharacterized membrane protein YgaE (UPF0421/DUF939 family)
MAYAPMRALGLNQDFWSAIAAIAVVQSEFSATQTTARDQFLGAVLGGIIGLVSLLVLGQQLAVYASAVVVAMVICFVLNVPSASRLAAVTATIILLVPHADSPLQMFLSRLTEVSWGVAVAVSIVWFAARLPAVWFVGER